MERAPRAFDLLIVSGCALILACGAGSPPAPKADAGRSRDAGAAADSSIGSAADGGDHAPRGESGATAAAPAAMSGSAGKAAPSAAGHAGEHSGNGGTGGAAPDRVSAAACDRCAAYAAPQQTGTIEPAELSALSGLAMSRSQRDILFAHNDHDRPVVYALDLQGKLHARITLDGAVARDIEDIAIGPCGGSSFCLYLADIGDNSEARAQYSLLRFDEPQVPSAPGTSEITLDSASYKQLYFTYEDGSHNAESMFIGPNNNVYIFTKNAPGSGGNVAATGPSDVFRIDASAFEGSAFARATKVTSLPIPRKGEGALSAVAISPCGLGFLARTYDRVYEFRGDSNSEAVFATPPAVVAMPNEPQSEGIDYYWDGRGFVTSGEGSGAPILLTACAP